MKFVDGYENCFTPWSGTNGSPICSTEQAHSGLRSLKALYNATLSFRYLASQNPIHVRLWLRSPNWGTVSACEFLRINNQQDVWGTEIYSLWKEGNQLKILNRCNPACGFGDAYYSGGLSWPNDTWLLAEGRIYSHTSQGDVKAWFNEAQVINVTGLNNSGAVGGQCFLVGNVYIQNGATPSLTLYVDDVAADKEYIGGGYRENLPSSIYIQKGGSRQLSSSIMIRKSGASNLSSSMKVAIGGLVEDSASLRSVMHPMRRMKYSRIKTWNEGNE